MANGTIYNLGTLWVNGVKRPLPTKPWRSDATPTGAPSVGNLLSYSGIGGNIEIKDTDADPLNKLKFVEVNDGTKTLLISDRCLLGNISWATLNSQGLITGKEVTIDGKKYILRVLTGGTNFRTGTDAYSGGTPTSNEWDRIITNEGSFVGLPTPIATDLDSTLNATDFSSVHNTFWNWLGIYSWCSETCSPNSSSRTYRGYGSPRVYSYYDYNTSNYISGWRPVLEVVNVTPTLSGADGHLGAFSTPIVQQYTATDTGIITDGILSVTEKINGTTIRTFNCTQGDTLTLNTSTVWDNIQLLTVNSIEIEITDRGGMKAKRLWTFTKALNPVLDTSSLQEIIDRMELLANGVHSLETTLRGILVAKGISVSDTDTLGVLIYKVSIMSPIAVFS